jgi:hypothetical protein
MKVSPMILRAAEKLNLLQPSDRNSSQKPIVLRGHGFSRAARSAEKEVGALAPEGMNTNKCAITRGLKPEFSFPRSAAHLKPRLFKTAFAVALLSTSLLAAGCHSYHVETTVENRTGAPLNLLEVDYPSASFGADKLAAGAVFHYRIQLNGRGPLKVQYTAAGGRQVQIDGPSVAERQEGQLEIILLPGDKAEFHPQLTPAQ